MFTWKTVYMEIKTKIENKINIKTHFKSPQNVIEMQHKNYSDSALFSFSSLNNTDCEKNEK